MTTEIVTDAEVEHLAHTVGFLAGEPNDTTLTPAAPVLQQGGGGDAPAA